MSALSSSLIRVRILILIEQALRHSKVKLTWDADDPHRKSKITSYLAKATESKGKGKSKLDILDDDIRAYLASSSDEDGAAIVSEEEVDDFFEKTVVEEKKGGKLGKRDQMRNLFGLDGGKESLAQSVNWDGGKGNKKGEGEMQITFAPALSDKRGEKFGPDDSDDDEDADEASRKKDETAIETYKRKERERRERKKAERKAKKDGVTLAPLGEEGPEYGGEDVGAGGFDDDFFAGKDDEEMFAAFDAGDDLDENGKRIKVSSKEKLSKRARREAKEAEEEADKAAQASLALMLDSESEGEGGKHFDMRSILKAEKNAGKKKIGKGKKGKNIEIQKKDGFEINVKDERFAGVYDDSNYAIDPTNPR